MDPRRRSLKLATREQSIREKRVGNPLHFKLTLQNLNEIPDVRDYVSGSGILELNEVSIRHLLSILVSDLNYARFAFLKRY